MTLLEVPRVVYPQYMEHTVNIEVVITHQHRCDIAVQSGTSLQG